MKTNWKHIEDLIWSQTQDQTFWNIKKKVNDRVMYEFWDRFRTPIERQIKNQVFANVWWTIKYEDIE